MKKLKPISEKTLINVPESVYFFPRKPSNDPNILWMVTEFCNGLCIHILVTCLLTMLYRNWLCKYGWVCVAQVQPVIWDGSVPVKLAFVKYSWTSDRSSTTFTHFFWKYLINHFPALLFHCIISDPEPVFLRVQRAQWTGKPRVCHSSSSIMILLREHMLCGARMSQQFVPIKHSIGGFLSGAELVPASQPWCPPDGGQAQLEPTPACALHNVIIIEEQMTW